ncbi:MAG: hypothetical protein WCL21_12405 [Mariniphaga sp.]
MDEYNIQEIKGRLIFLFRLLKVDTLICYDQWGLYEENPDHYITANFNYIREFVLQHDRINGAKYNLEWAECFHYIGPSSCGLNNYIEKNSIPSGN